MHGEADGALALAGALHYCLAEIYGHVHIAAAWRALGALKEAEQSLREALDLAPPDRLLLPLAENRAAIAPALERLRGSGPADALAAIEALARRHEKGCAAVLDGLHAKGRPFGLTGREHETALPAATPGGYHEETCHMHGAGFRALGGCVGAGRAFCCAWRAAASWWRMTRARTVLPEDAFPLRTVEADEANEVGGPEGVGWTLPGQRFFCVGEEAGSPYGLAAGLYVFRVKDYLVAFVPTGAAELYGETSLSPEGAVLALDSGASPVRSWFFFSYPDMASLSEVSYYQAEDRPGLLWHGNGNAVFSGMETEGHGRACGCDPCGPVSVHNYAFKTRQVTTLLEGTDLCDYTLTGLAAKRGVALAEELCLPSAADWEVFPEDAPTQDVEAGLPGEGR